MVPDIAVIVNPLLAVGDKGAQRADGDGFARFGDDHHEAFAVHRHKGLRRGGCFPTGKGHRQIAGFQLMLASAVAVGHLYLGEIVIALGFPSLI